jgi:branched-subunit amino acid ABC-type transport system permease component
VLQAAVNAVVYASEIGIIALGVSLAYALLRFANFAHVQLAVVGAYLTWVLAGPLALPLPLAALLSLVLTGGLAVLVDRLAFRPLRGARAETKMIVSWGVALLVRSALGAVFGGSARVLEVDSRPLRLGDVAFSTLDVLTVGVTGAAMVGLHLLLRRTRVGTALRALASNPDLAETRGIPGERLTALMWFLSGAYAALGGTLLAAQSDLRPGLDLAILLPVFAAATLGGLGSVFGAAAGALVLSLAQHLLLAVDLGALVAQGSWHLPSQFRDYLAVAALVLVLLLRPRGLAGRAGRPAVR